MSHWKHVAMLSVYVAIGLIVAGMLAGVVGGFLNPILGSPAAASTTA